MKGIAVLDGKRRVVSIEFTIEEYEYLKAEAVAADITIPEYVGSKALGRNLAERLPGRAAPGRPHIRLMKP